jgi:hypothetical protein
MKLLNVMTTNVDLFIDLRNQMGAFWTQVAFRTVIAIGTGGCILTAPIGIGVLCATAGYILIRPIKEAFGDAPSTPISTPPSDAPPSPSRQTENTQLQRLRLGTGTRRSYTFQYGGGQYCSYIGEYSNMIMGVRVTSAGDAISDAWLRFYQKETKTDPGCAPTLPVLPQNEHDYQFQSGNITNNNLTIQFRYMTGTPRCNVTFSGTRVGNSFSGQLFFDRNDGVVSTTDYFIAIPMVVQFL